MSNFPDLTQHGYQLIRELAHNKVGGRITYLATAIATQTPALVKQFQFARSNASWAEYEACDREIQMLKQLNHPGIPRYLDSFETPDSFCLVQEYKDAPSLAQSPIFTPEEIKQILLAVLEILVYLQSQKPPVIHRDIKPENILVERTEKLRIYLVDFGFARQTNAEFAASSAVKGTLGFMPPEQLFNRQLTEASDLYSLGATAICLLTHTKSTDIGNLIDEAYRINFKPLVPQLNPQFINWLEKMVAPSLKERFQNAAIALEALKCIEIKPLQKSWKPLFNAAKPTLITAASLTALGIAAAIFAPHYIKQERVRQLLETKQCPGCELEGVNLEAANLENVNLEGANLKRANLERANLEGANLERTNLSYANLGQTSLANANLANANLKRANLESANLGCVALNFNLNATDEGTSFNFNLGSNSPNVNPQDPTLNFNLDANDAGATLSFNLLGCADFQGANLSGATLPNGKIHP